MYLWISLHSQINCWKQNIYWIVRYHFCFMSSIIRMQKTDQVLLPNNPYIWFKDKTPKLFFSSLQGKFVGWECHSFIHYQCTMTLIMSSSTYPPGHRQTQGKTRLTLACASLARTQRVKAGRQRDLGLSSVSLLLLSWAR